YSIIGLEPDLIWRTLAGRAEINRNAWQVRERFTPCKEAPLAALRALVAESRIALPDALPPMAAGIFGYLGYDMVRLMEELPQPTFFRSCSRSASRRRSSCRRLHSTGRCGA